MKICVLGVGRSGTTALYVLAQEVLSSESQKRFHSFYEPFLRDSLYLDGPYHEVAGRMDDMASLSPEGILNHLRLPHFIDAPAPLAENAYLRGLFFPADGIEDLVVKFIRACGRFLLLDAICPQLRTVFLIRNPLDVVYSCLQRFSFFGGEFHRDDFPSFAAEVNRLYGAGLPTAEAIGTVRKELAYWYYMNRFALESFRRLDEERRPLVVCHEELVRDRKRWTRRICDHWSTAFSGRYEKTLGKPIGSVTADLVLGADEVPLFKEFFEKYLELLSAHGIPCSVSPAEVFGKYRISRDPLPRERRFYGLHARALARSYEDLLRKKHK